MRTKWEQFLGLSCEGENRGFFRRLDWFSFWTGALVSFWVYFATTAPSVTLEDAGELAVAGDYLGVPHPPGYPLWTMCAWVFARILGFVTYRGQPNPAWAIAVMSGFFGALACGITAMLVTRTSSDILKHRTCGRVEAGNLAVEEEAGKAKLANLICWASGVASSLVFAFSPVMWSQATIVEVYTLNAFFLMLIYLMTYRWMCRPTDKVLWLTAFVFGLGLTNYQVLLLAMLPLVIVILLEDITLFRDFALVMIPFGLTAGVMKLGAQVSQPGFAKHAVLRAEDITASGVVASHYYWTAIVAGLVFVVASVILGFVSKRRKTGEKGPNLDGFQALGWILFGISVVVLLGVCARVPTAVMPHEWQFAPPEAFFHWTLPVLAFLGGLACLFVFALFTPAGLWYAVAVSGIEIALAIFLKKGALLGLTHPLSGAFAFYVALNFVFLGLACLLLPRGRTVALAVLAAELGVAFYGYMPLSSETNPPMNWGYPRTWEGFKHALSRGQYERIAPTTMFSPLFVKQLGAFFADMRMQFTLILAPLGFLPFAVWQIKGKQRTLSITQPMVWIVGVVAALVAADKVLDGMSLEALRLDKLLVGIVLLAAFVGCHAIFVYQLVGLLRKALDKGLERSARLISGLAGIGLALVVIGFSLGFCNTGAETLLEGFQVLEPEVPATGGTLVLVYVLSLFFFAIWLIGMLGLGYFAWTRHARFQLEISDVSQRWHIATLTGFLMMSLVLIALANPKYDIQDNFIQKVKFISSHGIFALWIGYGMAYGLSEFHRNRKLCYGLIAVVLLCPLIPIHENYFNERLVDTMSAADQNGHDFGWQFGNYQLRGAEAIREELKADEEPLPNPHYPPAMTDHAIFFGGTDPGRFVPTYMIYSAQVRPDVYLITQNALADNTYMDTMRFLYADEIWMPTLDDNSKAFQQYIDDVQAGRRPNMGGISYEGGRVQVNGALAVMEINGILTEQIFRKNRDRHDFYVEESYAIRWMYPYLTPHGLILKLNHDPVPMTAQAVTNDMDFWDWYTRRLINNPKYPRDFVARKSFSKLRSAIAGTYSNRRALEHAERAFQESRLLYLYSPESNLRLIQEVLLPQERIDESVAILEQLHALDPNNTKVPINEIREMKRARDRVVELKSRRQMAGGLDEAETLLLAQNQQNLGMQHDAMETIQTHLKSGKATPNFCLHAGLQLARHGLLKEAGEVFSKIPIEQLQREEFATKDELHQVYQAYRSVGDIRGVISTLSIYLPRVPSDWQAWIDFAIICASGGDRVKAVRALEQAQQYGREEAVRTIEQIPALKALLEGQAKLPMR